MPGMSSSKKAVKDYEVIGIRLDSYEAPARFQDPVDLPDYLVKTGKLVKNEAREYRIEGVIGKRKSKTTSSHEMEISGSVLPSSRQHAFLEELTGNHAAWSIDLRNHTCVIRIAGCDVQNA